MKQTLTQKIITAGLATALALSPMACGRPRKEGEPRRPGPFAGLSCGVICSGALDGLNDFLEALVPGYNSGRGPYDDMIPDCYGSKKKK